MKFDWNKIAQETLPNCDEQEKANMVAFMEQQEQVDPDFKEYRRRWKALESWERFIFRRFYGKFRRSWTREARESVQKIADKLNLHN